MNVGKTLSNGGALDKRHLTSVCPRCTVSPPLTKCGLIVENNLNAEPFTVTAGPLKSEHYMPAFSSPFVATAAVLPELRLVSLHGKAALLAEHELVERARNGDRSASEQLVVRHVSAVLRRATLLMGNVADAEDVAQDAFYEALRDLKQLKDPRYFGPWVGQIAVHQMHRRFRRRRLHRALGLEQGEEEGRLADLAAPDTDPSVHAQLKEVDNLLKRAATSDRLAWMLRNVEGLPLAEVAELVQCSLATVKRRVAKVQQLLDAQFGETFIEAEL